METTMGPTLILIHIHPVNSLYIHPSYLKITTILLSSCHSAQSGGEDDA